MDDSTKNMCGHGCCGGHKWHHKCSRHSLGGCLWVGGWLFTVGFLQLSFWSGVLALVIWPYYLGMHFGG